MRKAVFLILLQAMCWTGFAENPRLTHYGTPIPARTNLEVRWNAPANPFLPEVWIYHLLPRTLSPQIISNLMTLCSFTDKDKTGKGEPLEFKSSDGTRRLWISYPLGTIYYEVTLNFNPTNLTKGLPIKEKAIKLTKRILPQLGVSLSDIDKKSNSSEPDFRVRDSETMFFVNNKFITNVDWRGVGFRRAVDGATFLSAGTGGDGDVRFGDHGKIIKINLSWQNMERVKSYPTFSPDTVIKLLREGKAIQGMIPMNLGGIDWPTVKSVTVNQAWICYYAGDPLTRSQWAYPFAALGTAVDTGREIVNVEIDCPIIDN